MMILWVAAQVAAASTSVLAGPMTASAAGWNAGDLDAFMAVYAEDAVYVTAKGILRGKVKIAARYAATFGNGRNARGQLSFQPLIEREIDPAHRLLVARWTVTGVKAETGMTTLLFERRGGAWKIVADHSS